MEHELIQMGANTKLHQPIEWVTVHHGQCSKRVGSWSLGRLNFKWCSMASRDTRNVQIKDRDVLVTGSRNVSVANPEKYTSS